MLPNAVLAIRKVPEAEARGMESERSDAVYFMYKGSGDTLERSGMERNVKGEA